MMDGKFNELSGEARYGDGAMAGDMAEDRVARVLAGMDRPVVPFGPRRVSTARAQHTTWPEVIRHCPDYLGWSRFFEVQGSDGETVIFKQAKLDSLMFWDTIMPVFFGIYLQRQDEVVFCDMASVLWAIAHPTTEEIILDADTKNPKDAFRVQVSTLLERRTVDAFAAHKADQVARGRKR